MAEAISSNDSSPTNLVIVNPANQITHVKLGDDNFLLWELQISSGIHGLGLEYLLTEKTPIPEKFSIEDGMSEKVNPLYTLWCRQDQLLFSFLLGSMQESIQAQMIGCTTSVQLWSRVTHLFATRSRARVMQYKMHLQTLKKGSLSMKDFLSKMKGYVDLLAACGHSISDDDHVLDILGGVGVEYEAVVVHINSRIEALSPADVSALLMAHEARIESYTANTDGSTPTINATMFSQSKGRDSHNQNSFSRGRGRGRSFRGGRKNWNNNNRPTCQIRGYSGHVAEKCYYRFDKEFVPQHRTTSFSPSSNQNRGQVYSPSAAIATKQPDMLNDEWWFPDSGASHHVTNDLANLTIGSEHPGEGKVYMGNGSALSISHIGASSFHSCYSKNSRTYHLNNLLCVPHITKNLVSVSKFAQDNNVYFEFNPQFCVVKDQTTKAQLLKGTLHEGLYRFHLSKVGRSSSKPASCLSLCSSSNEVLPAQHVSSNQVQPAQNTPSKTSSTLARWHYRLGHPMFSTVKKILSSCNVSFPRNDNITLCSACELGKNHKLPFPDSHTVDSTPLQLIFSDVWGPAHNVSNNGFRYYVSFVDAFSRYTWIFFLKHKSEVFQIFQQFKTNVELQCNHKIKALQTDWGGEYRSLVHFFKKFGIDHRVSCLHTSQQNGVVERKHRHIVDTGLSLLANAHMPLAYWDDAFSTSVYLINRLPSTVLHGQAPLHKLFTITPDYPFLRVFGCLCFPYLRVYNSHKLAFRSKACTFIGYSTKHKGYKCLSSDGRIFISRHVKFDESSFPFLSSQHSACSDQPPIPSSPYSHVSPSPSAFVPQMSNSPNPNSHNSLATAPHHTPQSNHSPSPSPPS